MENKTVNEILNEYKHFSEVQAIAIGGSSAAKTTDNCSDIDVYIFVKSNIPLENRTTLIKKYSSKYEIGGEYFGSGDEFWVDKINNQLDIMYWDINWFNQIVDNVWVNHFPSNGYTTAFLYTLNNFQIIYDTDNWLGNLQNKIKSPYPDELQENIIMRNMMLMKDKPFASYYEQIKKAIKRNDIVSINHRVAAFLASYFDVIFAINKLFHPGEKRLISFAKNNCQKLPLNFEENIKKLLDEQNVNILPILDEMVENLREYL